MSTPVLNITVTCRMCKKAHTIQADLEGFVKWSNNEMNVQDALPDLTPGQRELLISQTCETCFDKLFS